MAIGKRLEPIDSLQTEHSRQLLARASLSKEFQTIQRGDYLEKIPIGPMGSGKNFEGQEFGQVNDILFLFMMLNYV